MLQVILELQTLNMHFFKVQNLDSLLQFHFFFFFFFCTLKMFWIFSKNYEILCILTSPALQIPFLSAPGFSVAGSW